MDEFETGEFETVEMAKVENYLAVIAIQYIQDEPMKVRHKFETFDDPVDFQLRLRELAINGIDFSIIYEANTIPF